MNIPGFTAEASLPPASGHYQTSRYAITLPTRRIGGIHPARDEVIEVHSCAPGWTDIGGTCWPNPLTEPSSGSGTSDMPGGGGTGAPHQGTGGGPGKPPKPLPRRPTIDSAGDCFYGCGGTGCGVHEGCKRENGPICSCCYSDGCWICQQYPGTDNPTLCEWEDAYSPRGTR
jgi:hypothetical protein